MRRLYCVVAVCLHICAFDFAYREYVSVVYGYLGYAVTNLSGLEVVAVGFCAILPALILKIALSRPSDVIIWTLYVCVYIPSVYMPVNLRLQPQIEVFKLLGVLLVSMLILAWYSRSKKVYDIQLPVSVGAFWSVVGLVAASGAVYIGVIYWGRFRFVSMDRVYEDVRFSGALLAEGNYARYAVLLLGGAINPFFMSVGAASGRWRLFALGVAGQIVLYMTSGDRVYLLSPIAVYIFFWLVGRRKILIGIIYPAGAAGLILSLGIYNVRRPDAFEYGGGLQVLSNLVLMRTFAVPGFNTATYHDFFSDNPKTWYSHVNGINWLVRYPYQKSLGEVVGAHYFNRGEINSNAHFWATDGIAAVGLPGILLATLMVCCVLVIFDGVAKRHALAFVVPISVMPSVLLCNISLFTTLASGGLLIVIAVLAVMPNTGSSGRVCE